MRFTAQLIGFLISRFRLLEENVPLSWYAHQVLVYCRCLKMLIGTDISCCYMAFHFSDWCISVGAQSFFDCTPHAGEVGWHFRIWITKLCFNLIWKSEIRLLDSYDLESSLPPHPRFPSCDLTSAVMGSRDSPRSGWAVGRIMGNKSYSLNSFLINHLYSSLICFQISIWN